MKVPKELYQAKGHLSTVEWNLENDKIHSAQRDIIKAVEALGRLSAEIMIHLSSQLNHKG